MADPYFHRTLTLRAGGRRLSLAASQELFSSARIDAGTLRLLRSLAGVDVGASVLDLGCGAGPLALAAAVEGSSVLAVDRDALALEYTAANAAANGIDGVTVRGSLGCDDVEETFDAVLSNVPGKGTPELHRDLLEQAAARLRPGGLLAIVVVNPLVPIVASLGIEPEQVLPGPEHTVFHLRPPPLERRPSFAAGVYDRHRMGDVRTVQGLPEFDQLSFDSQLAIELLDQARVDGGAVTAVHPGQGHLLVAVGDRATSVHVSDRDLLALRATARALGGRCELDHAVWPSPPPTDLAILRLRRKAPTAVHERERDLLLAALLPGGRLLVAGSATAVDRVVAGRSGPRRQRSGHAAAILSPRS